MTQLYFVICFAIISILLLTVYVSYIFYNLFDIIKVSGKRKLSEISLIFILIILILTSTALCLLPGLKDSSHNHQKTEETIQPNDSVNIEKLLKACEDYGLKHHNIVVAQALLESNHFKSKVFLEQNNMFGMKKVTRRFNTQLSDEYISGDSKSPYASYSDWLASLLDYGILQYKFADTKSRETYYNWLEKSGYAQDPNYVTKVKSIVKQLDNKYGVR